MIDPPSSPRSDQPDRFMAAEARRGRLLAGRYELDAELGRGGMGRVYLAHDRILGRDVAVKILDTDDRADGDFTEACAREARAAARLVHPGIVTVHDIGAHDGQSFLVMELVPGPTLRRLLLDGPLAPARAVDIAAQVADALDYAHRREVLHCDVKPHNIIIRDESAVGDAAGGPRGGRAPEGRAKLVDFGIARAASVTGAFPDVVVGTVAYMAPEQVCGEPIDGRTDVYALGAVLYEMLVGRVPFEGDTPVAVLARRLVADPPPPRSLNSAIPPELERIVLTALRREPAGRYETAGAFRDALRTVEAGAGAQTRVLPGIGARPARRPTSQRRRPIAPRLQARLDPSGLRNRLTRPRLVQGLAGMAVAVGLVLVLVAVRDRPIAPATPPAATSPPLAAARPAEPTVLVPPTATTLPSPPSASETAAELPGAGWATFTRVGCEWSDATQSAMCFGTRPVGFRVRVVDRTGSRWMIWDPETGGLAYVNRSILQPD